MVAARSGLRLPIHNWGPDLTEAVLRCTPILLARLNVPLVPASGTVYLLRDKWVIEALRFES